jgi:trans-2,3-dihydro-3-hydroxyanthranilate isomerase
MAYKFVIADVFTDRPFGGNQLAVLPDAQGLSDRAMQAITREFNFAESTFVFPAKEETNTARLRIFSPASEVSFAGHPTVGTAAVLASLGVIDTSAAPGHAVFEEGVGPVNVTVEERNGGIFSQLTLEVPVDLPATSPSRDAVAQTLSLPSEDIIDIWYASAGSPYCYVQLTDKGSVDRAVLNHAAWATHLADAWAQHLYLFAGEFASHGRLYARMFAPAAGINEDAATGSACVGLIGTLAARSANRDDRYTLDIDQGVLMGRPSLINATATKTAGRVANVAVGGFTVVVGTGQLSIAAGF